MDNEIEAMLVKILEGQSRIEIELRKHSIKIGTMEENIKRIAGLQNAYKDQNEILFDNTDSMIVKKTDLLSIIIDHCKKRFQKRI
ncbi:hypothetical protein LGK95_10770 [Clostridium algoriphilum]|uniref:hypothetical protein n=1 Tax=Clostridium algoriphilum TaxID=198347 RepID=UPI001CF1C6E1|nr:hypothetical protein [Clostridium algoriphilum]MCB2294001.1 hypothetical protein [Clostridium algoriphilum]